MLGLCDPSEINLQRVDQELGSHSEISWETGPTRMVRDTKPSWRSFTEEGSLLARTFARQSSPASASGGQSLRGGWATQNPGTTLNQIQGVPGTGFPGRGENARKPVAGLSSQSYDSHRGPLGGKVAEGTLLTPSQSANFIQPSPRRFAKRMTWRMHAGP